MDKRASTELVSREKRETEAYLNRYISDPAKGWPRLGLCPLASSRSGRYVQTRRPGGY